MIEISSSFIFILRNKTKDTIVNIKERTNDTMIREIKGNIFDYITENDYIAHCISGDFALGAGIAKEIDKRYGVKNVLKSNPDFKKISIWNWLCVGNR